MSDRKIRVVSDRFNNFDNFFGDAIPVDLYGKRVWPTKSDSNRAEAAEDIKTYYGLEGDKGFS